MAHTVPDNPDVLVRRSAAAAALNAMGIPCAVKTLETQACRGGGPPFRLFGRIPLYRWGDVLEWAESKMSPPRGSTSEMDVQHPSQPRVHQPAKLAGRASKARRCVARDAETSSLTV